MHEDEPILRKEEDQLLLRSGLHVFWLIQLLIGPFLGQDNNEHGNDADSSKKTIGLEEKRFSEGDTR